MSGSFEALGWGQGALDPAPPVPAEGDPARRMREQALRRVLELVDDANFAIKLEPLFRRDDFVDPHAELVRFLCLVKRLVGVELPRLQKSLRCQSVNESRWMKDPIGGRVDLLGTLRAATASPEAPMEWLVRRTERFSDTPVNRYVATILRRADRIAVRASTHFDGAAEPLARQNTVLRAAHGEIERFFWSTPLGGVIDDPRASLDDLLAEARKRRGEFQRIRSLHEWWEELRQMNLERILVATRSNAMDTLSVHGCYELLVVSALLVELRARLNVEPVEEPGLFHFSSPRGRLSVELGWRPSKCRGRPPTAILRWSDATGIERRIVVEARNAAGIAAVDTLDRLAFLESEEPHLGILLTPTAPAFTPEQGPRWRTLPVDSHLGEAWFDILTETLGLKERRN